MQTSTTQSGINISTCRLSAVPGVGANRLRALITHFGSPTSVLEAAPRELIRAEGIDKKLASAIAHFTGGEIFAKSSFLVNKVNGRIVTLWHDEYPEYLRKIYDPPPLLFVLGTIEKNDKLCRGHRRNTASFGVREIRG